MPKFFLRCRERHTAGPCKRYAGVAWIVSCGFHNFLLLHCTSQTFFHSFQLLLHRKLSLRLPVRHYFAVACAPPLAVAAALQFLCGDRGGPNHLPPAPLSLHAVQLAAGWLRTNSPTPPHVYHPTSFFLRSFHPFTGNLQFPTRKQSQIS